MTEAISTLVGRVGFAAVTGIGVGLIFGQSWWIGVGATLVFASFPECLGFDISHGPPEFINEAVAVDLLEELQNIEDEAAL